MISYISKDEGNFDFSVHDPFNRFFGGSDSEEKSANKGPEYPAKCIWF